jgi:hypothetical protein
MFILRGKEIVFIISYVRKKFNFSYSVTFNSINVCKKTIFINSSIQIQITEVVFMKSNHDYLLLTIVAVCAIFAVMVLTSMANDITGKAYSSSASKAMLATDCSDTDSVNYFKQGLLTYTNVDGTLTEFKDFCRNYDSPVLVEYYCLKNSYASVDYKCRFGCINGACRMPSDTNCVDSDNGMDYYRKGTAAVKNSEASDHCTPNSQGLTEYYCSGARLLSKTVSCPNGCNDGACNSGKVSASTPSPVNSAQ